MSEEEKLVDWAYNHSNTLPDFIYKGDLACVFLFLIKTYQKEDDEGLNELTVAYTILRDEMGVNLRSAN
jgi:hypothetical protein